MKTLSPDPGIPVSQFPAIFQSVVPLAPVHVTVTEKSELEKEKVRIRKKNTKIRCLYIHPHIVFVTEKLMEPISIIIALKVVNTRIFYCFRTL